MSTFRARRAHDESSEELIHKPELTIEEVAELFQLSPNTIRWAVLHGELRARVVGHDTCGIARVDLIAWLKANSGS